MKNKIKMFCLSISFMLCNMVTVGAIRVNVHPEDDYGKASIGAILGVLFGALAWVGLIGVIFGLVNVYLSFKDSNADSLFKGKIAFICGICLIVLRGILRGTGVIQ